MDQPKISVLMSCYNAQRWLAEAIDSVLSQSYANFEFIIIDDGSKDSTLEIIRSYEKRENRIKTIAKSNTGLADSLNIGIFQARGQWIARLDADDLCETTRLEQQLAYVERHPQVILLGAGFLEIDENRHVIKKHRYPTNHKELKRYLERCQRFFPHSSAFYRTADVKQLGGYRPRIQRAQDWDLWLRLSENGQLGCLNKTLVHIRKHASQISHDESGRRQLIYSRAGIISHFLRKVGYADPVEMKDEIKWIQFIEWVEKRIDEEGVIENRRSWEMARDMFFRHENRLIGGFYFVNHLIRSGHASVLIKEKLLGSNLPERLAWEWNQRGSQT